MDQFLADYGMLTPYAAGTKTSINAGKTKLVVQGKDGGFFINDLWTSYGRVFGCKLLQPTSYKSRNPNEAVKPPAWRLRMWLSPQGIGEIAEGCVALAYAAGFTAVDFGGKVYSVEDRLFNPSVPKKIALGCPLLDGNLRYGMDPVKDALFQNVYYVNLKRYSTTMKGAPKTPPSVFDQNKQPANPSIIYSGCYATSEVSLSAYKGDENSGISISFTAVQFARDGDRLPDGYDDETAALAAIAAIDQPVFAPYVPSAIPAATAQGWPPGAIPVQQPAAAPVAQAPVVQAAPPPPPAPVWNGATRKWEFPQPAQPPRDGFTPGPAQSWQSPPNGAFTPASQSAPQAAALPAGFPPPR